MKYIVIFVVSFTLTRWGPVKCDQVYPKKDSVVCWGKQIDRRIDSIFSDSLTAVTFYNRMISIEDSMNRETKRGYIAPTNDFLIFTEDYQFEKRLKTK